MARKLGLLPVSCLLVCLWPASQAWAAGALSVQIVSGYNLIVDSNVTAPSTYAPSAAYIGAQICNVGNAPLSNVLAYSGNYNAGVGSTPGTFPVKSFGADPLRPFLAGTGNYSLTISADQTGTADGTRYIGTLNGGECRIQYWLITYPQCVNVNSGGSWVPQAPPCSTSITGDIKPDDDLSLDYDVWASAAGATTVSSRRSFTMRNEISAAANKIWPNTTAKVPDAYLAAIQSVIGWGTLGPDGQPLSSTNAVYPGQRVITTQGIWYDLGNVGQGFDNDGDLVPDQNAWLQPVGDPGTFDADCFRMVNVYGIVIVKLKTGGELLIPFQNQLYHEHIPDNTGVVGLVYYQYVATDEGCSAGMTPYQEAASGYDNEKFSSDFGLSNPLTSASFGAGVTFTKTDGVTTIAPGSTPTYTISATNNLKLPYPAPNDNLLGVPLGAPDLGVPLVFKEKIPSGTTYVQNSAAMGLTPPSGSGSYYQGYTDASSTLQVCLTNYTISSSSWTILYSTDGGVTFGTTQPASGVTDIEWILSTTLSQDGGPRGNACVAPGGGNLTTLVTSLPPAKTASVQFQTTLGASAGPIVCNTARFGFGGSTSKTTAEDCDVVSGPNTLSGFVFQDNGSAAFYANGTKDAGEGGIGAGVVVKLYYDRNGDGKYDSADIQYASTTTAADGSYAFTSIADGRYLVVASKYQDSAGSPNDVDEFVQGWGDTTKDPDLPLTTTTNGALKLNEDQNRAMLAVNVDYPGTTAGTTTVGNVNFGFAPPLRMTKTVPATTVGEGDIFNYTISLENRLPSRGRQGPTGCEYTFWGTNGVTDTSGGGQKAFTNYPSGVFGTTQPTNAYDGSSPNGTLAYAPVTNGGLRVMYDTAFNVGPHSGNITKVEALYFGYFGNTLNNDILNLTIRSGASQNATTIFTAQIDSYVGPPADFDDRNAISWDVTTVKPGGGAWAWTDNYAALQLEVNPTKTAGADAQVFYLDDIGLRITTDTACVASTSTTLDPVPLQDRFDSGSFAFVSASPPPTTVSGATIRWDNVGPILPGSTTAVTVTVRALNITGTRTGTCAVLPPPVGSACNVAETAYLTKNVYYADGRRANDASASVPVNIVGKGEIRGLVWSDTNNNGWRDANTDGVPDDGEPSLPNVKVTLFACYQVDGVTLETSTASSKTCASANTGNSWRIRATTYTDASGAYEFIGLDTGTYIVEVGDTDGAPQTGNASPFGKAQTAEPNDTQAVSGTGNALGTTGVCAGAGGCNNTWGNPNNNLNQFNQIAGVGTEEKISGVNFGYFSNTGALYGNVWHDIDGNATQDVGDSGLLGFTVQLYVGTTLQATTTTDASGNYSFGALPPNTYVIKVTPPTLKTQAWVESVETSNGGTIGTLDNQITVTLAAGVVSGAHNFAYTLKSTSEIGDTLYIDTNGNGSQDAGEPGIPNVTVFLYKDVDRDGSIDPGVDELVGTAVSDASGHYLFCSPKSASCSDDLAFGSYVVKVDTTDPDFPAGLTPNGDPDVRTARIGGRLFQDVNRSGTLDASDVGLEGVVVRVWVDVNGNSTRDAGEAVAAAITDVNGNYLVTGMSAGTYRVEIDTTTLPASARFLTTSDPGATPITLGSTTASYLAANAGYRPASSASAFAIGDRVWHDYDNDNVQDPGEPGVAGVKITVTGTGCAPCTATTDAAGFWTLSGLAAGTYSVAADTTGTAASRFVLNTAQTGQNPRSVTITTADVMSADFGYRYTGSGSASGTITGRVFLDKNANKAYDSALGEAMSGTTVNLLDDANNIVATTTTAADGTYAFNGVFVGTYTVQAVDTLGGRYSVILVSNAEPFPNVNVIYSQPIETVPDSQSSVSVDGVHDDLLQDFGYRRDGIIGDTIFQDVNGNGTQDLGEPGIPDVTVYLYQWVDANGDGVVDAGELSNQLSATTTADDPSTSADEGGKYFFGNLADPVASGFRYVVRVDTATLPGSFTLTADPDTDGVPCTSLPAPSGCDNQHVAVAFKAGNNYLGADFGYQISGTNYGHLGDHLWVDTNNNGVLDAGEIGVRYITVWLDTNNNGAIDAGEPTTQTDADGYYVFANLPSSGSPYRVRVLTSDPDWPAGLPTTPTFEAGTAGSFDNNVTVTITNGVVTNIGGNACSNCDLSVDFGYRYAGNNTLSGTVCVEGTAHDGFCGSIPTVFSGVAADESALSGVQVNVYRWVDDGDGVAWNASGVLDPGDTFTLLGSTTSGANGDYSFSGLPASVVLVFGVPSAQNLDLTTTNANSSVSGATKNGLFEGTTTYQGHTVTVIGRQALSALGATTQGVDFAFDSTLGGAIANDFGDLPNSGTPNYHATLLADGGAQARIGTVFLGSAVTAELDGYDSANASADSGDDGVPSPPTSIKTGAAVDGNGGSVDVLVSPAASCAAGCWLAAWMDFNQDGDFADAGEQIISRSVTSSATPQTIPFDVPSTVTGGTSTYFVRFRIYASEPLLESATGPALDSTFQPLAGEVEDYQWTLAVTKAVVTSFLARDVSGAVALEWQTSSETGTIGFFLQRWDEGEGRWVDVNERLLPALIGHPQGGVYRYVDPQAVTAVSYHYRLVEVEASGQRNTYGPFPVNTAMTVYAREPAAARRLKENPHELGYSRAAHLPSARATKTRAQALAGDAAAVAPVRASATKIGVQDSGIYYVALSDLRARGGLTVPREWLSSNRNFYALTNRGVPVAFTPSGDEQGILFYGRAVDSLFTRDNVYRLGESTTNGPRMRVRKNQLTQPPRGNEIFVKTLHMEKDVYPANNLFTSAEADYWMWDWVFAGSETKSFTFRTDGAARMGQASLTIHLLGATDTPANPDHHAVIRLNGNSLGELSWNGTEGATQTFSFDASLLSPTGESTVEVEGLTDTEAPYSFFYMNSFDVRYASYYRAYGNRIEAPAAGNPSFVVSGFSRPDIMVFDVTDPIRPVYVQATASRVSDGTYGVALSPETSKTIYDVVTPDGVLGASRIVPDTPSSLRDPSNQGEYLVITTRALKDTAQTLANLHSDLRSQVVDIEDIYDEFSFGLADPHALKDFLTYARSHWGLAPRYVVLAGDGTWDYKDNWGYGGNLIPPMIVGTPSGIFASDAWFGEIKGGTGPDIAIGRLPAATTTELAPMIAKVETRQAAAADAWAHRVFLLADNPDNAGDFTLASERVGALAPPAFPVRAGYLSGLGLDGTRDALFGAIGQGTGFVSYFGHGGYDVLADEGLLRSSEIDALNNTGAPTVMTAMTCIVGDFSLPGYPSLAENMVRKETGGAVAVWAPTGMSENQLAIPLAEGFYSSLFGGSAHRLGDAVVAGRKAYLSHGGPSYMLWIYTLLGDPAMRLE